MQVAVVAEVTKAELLEQVRQVAAMEQQMTLLLVPQLPILVQAVAVVAIKHQAVMVALAVQALLLFVT
jgi:hypothetical protein